jgi:hypothetical protein
MGIGSILNPSARDAAPVFTDVDTVETTVSRSVTRLRAERTRDRFDRRPPPIISRRGPNRIA